MKSNCKFSGFLFFALISTSCFAALDEMVSVNGVVVSFDSKVVRVFNHGQISLVPRTAAPKQLRAGQEITATFNLEEFKKQIPDSKVQLPK